jgi:hypothetical protein
VTNRFLIQYVTVINVAIITPQDKLSVFVLIEPECRCTFLAMVVKVASAASVRQTSLPAFKGPSR